MAGKPRSGNTRHGAKAQVLPARLSERAAAIDAELAAAAPVRAPDGSLPAHDAQAVHMLATCLCRLEDVGGYLDRHGSLDGRGKPRSAALWERRLQSQALKLMTALGMTPSSRARLGLDLARTVDLAQAMSHPDPQQRSALLREAGLDLDSGAGA